MLCEKVPTTHHARHRDAMEMGTRLCDPEIPQHARFPDVNCRNKLQMHARIVTEVISRLGQHFNSGESPRQAVEGRFSGLGNPFPALFSTVGRQLATHPPMGCGSTTFGESKKLGIVPSTDAVMQSSCKCNSITGWIFASISLATVSLCT